MSAGLFELRKDPITSWWVATVVDRQFHRDRFARAAEPVDDRMFGCANCSSPPGDGIRTRMLKDFAFHVVGTDDDARELDRNLAQVALAQARASGSWRTHDGYVRNTFIGNRVEDQDTSSARLQFVGEPSDSVRVSFTLDGTRDRATGPAQHVLDLDPGADEAIFWTVDRDRDRTAGSTDGFQDRDTWGVRAQAAWDLPFGTINYLVGHREVAYDVNYDFDGGPRDAASRISIAGGNVEQSEMTSHELRLLSPADSRISWVLGLYAYDSDTRRDDILNLAIPDFDVNFEVETE